MKATKLKHDSEIKKAYSDPNTSLYFREGNEGEYELVGKHSLEDVLDATCHGFEFVAVDTKFVSENELEFVEETEEIER